MRPPAVALLVVSLSGMAVSCSGSSQGRTADLPRAAGERDAGAGDAGPDQHIPALSGPPRLLEGRYFVDEGAPHPIACSQDKDCIGDTVPDDTGCCVRTSDPYPQTFAWHAWATRRRLSPTCGEARCPPLPVPSMPEACRLNVRCEAGTCRDTCDESPPGRPPEGEPLDPSELPGEEQQQRQDQAGEE